MRRFFAIVGFAALVHAARADDSSDPAQAYDVGRGIVGWVHVFEKWRLCVLDTGADSTLFDLPLTNRLGISTGTAKVDTPHSATEPIGFFEGTNIFVGGQWTKPDYVGVADLSGLREFVEDGIEGIVGVDAFKEHFVRIGFQPPRFSLSTNLPFPLRTGLALEAVRGNFVFNAELPDGQMIELVIDTGFSGMVDLNPADWAKAFPTEPERVHRHKSMDFIGRESDDVSTRLKSLRVGREIYTNLYCARIANTNLPSVVGLEFLRMNETIMNFPDRLVNFRRVLPQRPNDHNMSGIGLKWAEGRRPVIHVIEKGSPAEGSELKEGDEILKMDGVEVAKFSKFRMYELLRKGEDQRLRIEAVREGRVISVEIVLKANL